MSSIETKSNGTGASPKITLYTNHICPFAHRAHITLKELDLPYEEVIIDLDRPRDPWYLDINPRGLVPSIKFSNDILSEEIITESAIVANFLADTRPSHLLPASDSKTDPRASLIRARIAFFTDTWDSKVASFLFATLRAADAAEAESQASQWLAAITKEIEPLLKDAAPFFGGSKELTIAEVHTAPFVLRYYALAKAGLLPKSFGEGLDALPNFSKWAKAVTAKESVTAIWNEENVVERTRARIAKAKAQQ